MTDLSIEDFKEIYLKACFANGDNTPNATSQKMADYFEYESFKFMKKYSDDTLRETLQDMVFKKFIGGLENAKIELESPFVEYEQRRLLEIDSLKVNGVDITKIELPSRYGYSIPMSMVSNRLGGRLELWVVDAINEGFKLFLQLHEESNNLKQHNSTTSLQAEEDFIKLFLDSFAGKEIKDINQIVIYFKRESFKFINKNTKENSTSKERDLMLGEFLEKVEYAKKEIDKPFLMYEKRHLDRIFEAESKGYDTSNYVVPDLSKTKLQMFEIYSPYKGVLYYWEVQWVYQGFELFKREHEIDTYMTTTKPPKQQAGFNSGFPDEQLKVLHKALIDNKFLDDNTDEGHFINAFNGKVLDKDFKPLKWIDETQKNHHISIQTVFQLLDSCKIELDGKHNIIIKEVRETVKLIFKNDFGNIQTKYSGFNPLKTPRHTLIDSIVKNSTLYLNKI